MSSKLKRPLDLKDKPHQMQTQESDHIYKHSGDYKEEDYLADKRYYYDLQVLLPR
tara:strand:+ start:1014 stop:1178 length:165 start_codon:yes stop_codon:yes gene_type:complete